VSARALVAAMGRIAPLHLAAAWDNVGLLIGSEEWEAERILLTTDLTAAVLDEAQQRGCEAIVAYHPPIFAPLKRLTDAPPGRIALGAAAARIAVYSPHTALDAAPGGLCDWLAQGLGAGRVIALEPALELPETEQAKLVTFCPRDSVAAIRDALARAGCGRIGDYEQCSFELHGHGTFYGGETTNPAVGQSGTLERVEEARFEMVCSRRALPAALRALRQAHPYEEPPIEIHALLERPRADAGQGRVVELDAAIDLATAVRRTKDLLGLDQLRVAAAAPAPRPIRAIGLCPGAGGELVPPAIAAGCTLFVTGEMRHHDVLAACERGCAVLLAGHTNTERP
jgi:dinuclear metal center YbgI/SA1388 family protein